MRKILVPLATALALAGMAPALAAVPGEAAPAFVGQTLDGKIFRLESVLGEKVVLLNFWSVFCRDCIARIEAFNKMQERFRARPFVQMGICGDQLSSRMLDQVKKYAARMEYPVVLDPDLRVYELFGAEIFPYIVVIGRDQRIALVIKDLDPESLKKLNDKVDELTR